MTRECVEFMNLRTKPGLCGSREASWILGVPEDWIWILVKEEVLPIAGQHQTGCQFYFCTSALIELAQRAEFSDQVVTKVRRAFKKKNKKADHQVATRIGGNHA